MSTTVRQTTDWTARPTRSRRQKCREQLSEIVQEIEDLADLGLMRAEIASRLNLTDSYRGSLARNLQRAGRHDLLARITPENWGSERRAAGIAAWRERRSA